MTESNQRWDQPQTNLIFYTALKSVKMSNSFSGIHGPDELKGLKEGCQLEEIGVYI